MEDLIRNAQQINHQLARYGVKFGIYKNGTFQERLFPFDAIPRIISAQEWTQLEKGLIQRVNALNLFLRDIYDQKRIIADGVVPEDFVYRSPGYLPQCEGILPRKGIYSHISGIDLVKGKDGAWYILEDNLRIPSGASYPLIARSLCRQCSPETFRHNDVVDNRNYGELLRSTMDSVSAGGINVVFTPGRYNAAYFEHSTWRKRPGPCWPSPPICMCGTASCSTAPPRGISRWAPFTAGFRMSIWTPSPSSRSPSSAFPT